MFNSSEWVVNSCLVVVIPDHCGQNTGYILIIKPKLHLYSIPSNQRGLADQLSVKNGTLNICRGRVLDPRVSCVIICFIYHAYTRCYTLHLIQSGSMRLTVLHTRTSFSGVLTGMILVPLIMSLKGL